MDEYSPISNEILTKRNKKILKNINSQDEKISNLLKKLKNKYFFLSRVKAADLNLIFELSNQKTVRKWSFNKSKIDYENHKKWFKNILNKKNCFFGNLLITKSVMALLDLKKK